MPTPPPKETQKFRQWLIRHIKILSIDVRRLMINVPQVPNPGIGAPFTGPNPAVVAVPPVGFGGGIKVRQGFLAEDLTAPSDVLGPATTAVVHEYQRDPANDKLVYIGDFTAYNWDESLTADAGTYVKCEDLNGVKSFYWVGCEAKLFTFTDSTGSTLLDDSDDPIFGSP